MEALYHLRTAEVDAAFAEEVKHRFVGQNIVITVTAEVEASQNADDPKMLTTGTGGISAASNVLAPAYYVLKERGYVIAYDETHEWWTAEKAGAVFIAYSTIELCGLVYIHEQKGENWQVSDEAIDKYLKLEKLPDSPNWDE